MMMEVFGKGIYEFMEFGELLNFYIEETSTTAKEIADYSGLGTSTISRYRNGERIPNRDEVLIHKIAEAICQGARRNGDTSYDVEEVFEKLLDTIPLQEPAGFATRFNTVMDVLEINGTKLASYMNYDPSTISRIRTNKRSVNNISQFVDKFVEYIVSNWSGEQDRKRLAKSLRWNETVVTEILADDDVYAKTLANWLLTPLNETENSHRVDPTSYLTKLDEFNLDDYIEAIHFNDIKVPSIPFQLKTRKSYVGLEQMREGELDFIKATVLSKSNEPVTMCSDMPMEDMAEDIEFGKKWMFGLAVILKKGLKMNVVHNLDRPFEELMLGLESWIPLYMTGQIHPYYFEENANHIYGHLHYSSGETALVGECIIGHHDQARYYLTRKKQEVELYKSYSANLLEKALPLMKIYTRENREDLYAFLFQQDNYGDRIVHKYTVPPIYSMSEEQLIKILESNQVDSAAQKEILDYRNRRLVFVEEYLKCHSVQDCFYIYSKDEFEKEAHHLNVAEAFCNKEICYTFEDYQAHLDSTLSFEKEHEHYSCIRVKQKDFKGIQFTMAKGKWVLVSKGTHPNISFLIMHPVLRDAIENMKLLVVEDTDNKQYEGGEK